MRISTTLLALSLAATATAAAAQAPVITERGDPSVRDDTIYKLAVKPDRYPDDAYVILLDDGVERFDADGTGTRTFRTVAQVLTQDAVEGFGERSFGYDASRQRLRLNWARVIDAATGRVISDKPVHDQESLAPVAESAPVFTDEKVRRISLGGVAPGTIVDISYTLEVQKPVMPGDWDATWSIHNAKPTLRSRLLLDLPASVTPRIKERNLSFARQTREVGGRRVYSWMTHDVPKVDSEPFAADSNGIYMSFSVAPPVTWGQIASWYAGLSADRYVLTPAIEAKLADVTKDAKTREDSLRAVHRWVAQDFRYVSLSLGIGGYQPRLPAQVWETQYGDCKDKATFFVALMRKMGYTAYPVLLSSDGGVARDMPSVNAFDHMIAAVERPGGGYQFFDLTADLTPYGEIVPNYQGEFGLVVHPDGRGEEVTFPRNEPTGNRTETRIAGELTPDGEFHGGYSQLFAGATQYSMRDALSSKVTDKQREQMTRSLANAVFEGATGDSLQIFDGRDLRAQPRISIVIRDAHPTSSAGATQILALPLHNYATQGLINDLLARQAKGPRRFPIDVASVIGPFETTTEMLVKLPEGWHASLPKNVTANSVFGRYTAQYTQTGRDLRVVRTMVGARGTQPPEAIDALISWLKDVSKDDVRFIALEPAPETK
jgi:transglutaminase-like putative cysteine protease